MENYAGNIIANLAGLPEFLRKPMLRSRMAGFPDLPDDEKAEVIDNALAASPAVPFDLFAKLFGTWLSVLAEMDERGRRDVLEYYARHLAADPARAAPLHADGLAGVFGGLDGSVRDAIAGTVRDILGGMEPGDRRRILLLMPTAVAGVLEA